MSVWRDRVALFFVVAAGTTMALLAGGSLLQTEDLRREEQKTAAIQVVQSTFLLELTRTIEAVRAAGVMLESLPRIGRDQFYASMETLVAGHLNVDLMEWQPIVPAGQLSGFEAEARASGLPGYRVVQPDAAGTGWEPVQGRAEYVPVLFGWPPKFRTEGLDMSFSPERMASKWKSHDLRQPVASGTFRFMKEGMVDSGVTALAISTTVFDTNRRARGYLAAVMDLSTLFKNAARLAVEAHFDLLVFDASAPALPPVFTHFSPSSGLSASTAGLRELTSTDKRVPVSFAQQEWTLVLHPLPSFYARSQGGGSALAFGVGMGMTLLITLTLYLLQKSRRRIEKAEALANQARREREHQSERMQEAQRIAHVGSWEADLATDQVVWSEELFRIHGRDLGSPAPDYRRHPELFTPASAERLQKALGQTVSTGTPYELELEFLRPNGTPGWILSRGEAVRDADGHIVTVLGVSAEITQRKQAEAALIQWEDQRHQIQKAESLGLMAASVAHHFNNSLQSVIANLELLSLRPSGADPGKVLSRARLALEQAATVSRQLLGYIGNNPGRRERLSLGEFCATAVPELQRALPRGVSVTFHPPTDDPFTVANGDQLKQVLANLVANAGEAMSLGGEIHLRVETRAAQDLPTTHRFPAGWGAQGPWYACLAVEDEGGGIAEEEIAKLFDPFFSTKSTGRGLGLSVALGLVQAHGGAIAVETTQGQGSLFRVFLPVSTEQPREVSPPPPVPVSIGTVLLVDDDPLILDSAAELIELLGFPVLRAKDGVEALEVFQRHRNDIGCVLTDLTMPRMDGWGLLSELRTLVPDLPVILASGYDKAQILSASHGDLPQAFLSKPFDVDQLREALGLCRRAPE